MHTFFFIEGKLKENSILQVQFNFSTKSKILVKIPSFVSSLSHQIVFPDVAAVGGGWGLQLHLQTSGTLHYSVV